MQTSVMVRWKMSVTTSAWPWDWSIRALATSAALVVTRNRSAGWAHSDMISSKTSRWDLWAGPSSPRTLLRPSPMAVHSRPNGTRKVSSSRRTADTSLNRVTTRMRMGVSRPFGATPR